MPENDAILPAGSGPTWSLTPKGRRLAKLLVAGILLSAFAVGCTAGYCLFWLTR